ncbi:hypothetical protein BACCIP111883_02622 [Sutcliffiella rhizosphaerae]|uniref:50S ribosomal protein L20 n=1 Tax=Sutcliffiella rhizosphaerae TaxID=2880967 RepID=A0ABM8YPL2_9BACI|nr:hypothetical protein BACCIP111883_02622 [Sutcliffiella rhizosphaerae]
MGYSKKQKRRLGKALARRHKQSLARARRNIFVKAGILELNRKAAKE